MEKGFLMRHTSNKLNMKVNKTDSISFFFITHLLLGNVKFQHMEDSVYKPVSFTSHHTYLGLPQLKAYNMIDIYFQLKTSDEDGLILYNGGKGDDFVAVELIRGHIHYTFNMGYIKINKRKSIISVKV